MIVFFSFAVIITYIYVSLIFLISVLNNNDEFLEKIKEIDFKKRILYLKEKTSDIKKTFNIKKILNIKK